MATAKVSKKKKTKDNDDVWFVCRVCGRAYRRAKLLVRHKRESHQFDETIVQDSVQPDEPDEEELAPPAPPPTPPPPSPPPPELNLEIFTTQTDQRCPICRNFVHTWPSDRNSAVGAEACRYCEKKFKKRGSRILHERNHKKNEEDCCTRCVLCRTLFTNFSDLELHQKICKNPTDWDPHVCRYCGKILKDMASRQIHQKIHADEEKPFACKICKKDFTRKETRKKYTRTHYSVEKRFTVPPQDQPIMDDETIELCQNIPKKKKIKKSISKPIKKTIKKKPTLIELDDDDDDDEPVIEPIIEPVTIPKDVREFEEPQCEKPILVVTID